MYYELITRQRSFFQNGNTKALDIRIKQIEKLKSVIKSNEKRIIDALKKDLNKAKYEAYLTEILVLYEEINFTLKHLKKWSKAESVPTPIHLQPGRGKIIKEPYGIVGIFAPWNYPFQLVISPLIGAMAAGNCAVLKPADLSSHTQTLILDLINNNFDSSYIYAIGGGVSESEDLLKENFDFIFFTGSPRVGKIVMSAAANHLTPVCLELGGKSPCIVEATANLSVAASKIVWAKFLNSGQTCVAPDFVYVERSVGEEFKALLKNQIQQAYGIEPKSSPDYGRIISEKHFARLKGFLKKENIYYGGDTDITEKYISPTILQNTKWNEEVMQEEIFGPILPILEFETLNDVIDELKKRPKPLALYCFSESTKNIEHILDNLSSGGVCINDCIVHLGNPNLPFGGVGNSGMNHYHGKFSFDLFSNKRAIHQSYNFFEMPFRYPPYKESKLKFLKKFF